MIKPKISSTKQLRMLESRLRFLRKALEVDRLHQSVILMPVAILRRNEEHLQRYLEIFKRDFSAKGLACISPLYLTHDLTFHKPAEVNSKNPADFEAKFYEELDKVIPYEDMHFLMLRGALTQGTYKEYSKLAKKEIELPCYYINHKIVSEAIKDLQAERDVIQAATGKKVL